MSKTINQQLFVWADGKELPKESGIYGNITKAGRDYIFEETTFDPLNDACVEWWKENIVKWLKPVEVPSEEKIKADAKWFTEQMHPKTDMRGANTYSGFIAGFKHAVEILITTKQPNNEL